MIQYGHTFPASRSNPSQGETQKKIETTIHLFTRVLRLYNILKNVSCTLCISIYIYIYTHIHVCTYTYTVY